MKKGLTVTRCAGRSFSSPLSYPTRSSPPGTATMPSGALPTEAAVDGAADGAASAGVGVATVATRPGLRLAFKIHQPTPASTSTRITALATVVDDERRGARAADGAGDGAGVNDGTAIAPGRGVVVGTDISSDTG